MNPDANEDANNHTQVSSDDNNVEVNYPDDNEIDPTAGSIMREQKQQ